MKKITIFILGLFAILLLSNIVVGADGDVYYFTDTDITFESTQFGIFISLILFLFFFYIGYTQEKNTGGFLMFMSGFMFLALNFMITDYVDSDLVKPFLGFIGIFIIVIGLVKWLYWDEDKGKIIIRKKKKS